MEEEVERTTILFCELSEYLRSTLINKMGASFSTFFACFVREVPVLAQEAVSVINNLPGLIAELESTIVEAKTIIDELKKLKASISTV